MPSSHDPLAVLLQQNWNHVRRPPAQGRPSSNGASNRRFPNRSCCRQQSACAKPMEIQAIGILWNAYNVCIYIQYIYMVTGRKPWYHQGQQTFVAACTVSPVEQNKMCFTSLICPGASRSKTSWADLWPLTFWTDQHSNSAFSSVELRQKEVRDRKRLFVLAEQASKTVVHINRRLIPGGPKPPQQRSQCPYE